MGLLSSVGPQMAIRSDAVMKYDRRRARSPGGYEIDDVVGKAGRSAGESGHDKLGLVSAIVVDGRAQPSRKRRLMAGRNASIGQPAGMQGPTLCPAAG